jgi:hypothetical protein
LKFFDYSINILNAIQRCGQLGTDLTIMPHCAPRRDLGCDLNNL